MQTVAANCKVFTQYFKVCGVKPVVTHLTYQLMYLIACSMQRYRESKGSGITVLGPSYTMRLEIAMCRLASISRFQTP